MRLEAIASRLKASASRLEAIAIRLEAILSGWRSSLVDCRPSLFGLGRLLLGWRPLLLGWRSPCYWVGGRCWLEAIASGLEAIAIGLEAIASSLLGPSLPVSDLGGGEVPPWTGTPIGPCHSPVSLHSGQTHMVSCLRDRVFWYRTLDCVILVIFGSSKRRLVEAWLRYIGIRSG